VSLPEFLYNAYPEYENGLLDIERPGLALVEGQMPVWSTISDGDPVAWDVIGHVPGLFLAPCICRSFTCLSGDRFHTQV
jgi:hypothetical protein